jgi:hypothetical protein
VVEGPVDARELHGREHSCEFAAFLFAIELFRVLCLLAVRSYLSQGAM